MINGHLAGKYGNKHSVTGKSCLICSEGGTYAAFTLIEMLVVIAIIGILAALMMPSLHSALESSRQMVCANNQKQIGYALHSYSSDSYGYWLNASTGWPNYMWVMPLTHGGYVEKGRNSQFVEPGLSCPSNDLNNSYHGNTYAPIVKCDANWDKNLNTLWGAKYNGPLWMKMSSASRPSQTIIFYEWVSDGPGQHFLLWEQYANHAYASNSLHSTGYSGGYMVYDDVHNDGSNMLYADGHVKRNMIFDWDFRSVRAYQ